MKSYKDYLIAISIALVFYFVFPQDNTQEALFISQYDSSYTHVLHETYSDIEVGRQESTGDTYESKGDIAFYLLLLFFFILYTFSLTNRVEVKRIRKALIILCLLQIILLSFGTFISIMSQNEIIVLAVFYMRYIPILMIPALMLYIGINSGHVAGRKKLNRLYKIYFFLTLIPLGLILTNSFHELVFIIHNPFEGNHELGTLYPFIAMWSIATIILASSVLMYKTFTTPKKLVFLLPLLANVLAVLYVLLYDLSIWRIRELSMSYGLSVIIFINIEAYLQSRIFPSNRGYTTLFAHSHFCMELRDSSDKLILQSSVVPPTDNHNFIKRENPIAGGKFIYYEDHTALNKARESLAESNLEIKKNNAFLNQQSNVDVELASIEVQKIAYRHVDQILMHGINKIESLLSTMENMDKIKEAKKYQNLIDRINVIACAIKRESILLINYLAKQSELSKENILEENVDNFIASLYEMQDFTKNSELNIIVSNRLTFPLAFEYLLGMYKTFSVAVEKALEAQSKYLLVQFYEEEKKIVFSLMADNDWIHEDSSSLLDEIFPSKSKNADSFKKLLLVKQLDETKALLFSITKPKEEANV